MSKGRAKAGLPKRAGKVRLRFETEWLVAPLRDGNTIMIPGGVRGKLHMLEGQGEGKFLLSTSRGFYFGGTDERPFLAQFDFEAYYAFLDGGEDSFFEALKPAIVRQAEQRFKTKARRQGEFFAVKFPFSWRELVAFGLITGAGPIKSAPFFPGSNHLVTGTCAFMYTSAFWTKFGRRYARFGTEKVPDYFPVVEGTVKAPDHAPLVLKGPHLMARNRHLIDNHVD